MIVWAIARNTAREAIRNKVLYSSLFFAFLMVGVSAVFGAASIGDEMKFIKDFSLLAISLFGVVITVVLGVNLLQKEIGRKTIFNILSKPVARWQFLLGKYLGLFLTLALLVGVMSAALLIFLRLVEGSFDWNLLWATGAILLELSLLLAVALLFSSVVVTPALAGLFTVATFIAGRSSSYLSYFMTPEHPPLIRRLMSGLYMLLPHLDRYWISDQVVYHQSFSLWYFANLLLYAAAYAGLVLLLSLVFLNRREFT